MFNVFYSVTYANGFYSFQARSGVAPVCSVPLKSLHDWKQKFFYIRRGVIPIDMPYRQATQGVPRVDVMEDYGAQDWFKRITQKATAISQLDEMALVGAGMSLLWVPKNPLGQPVYSYRGKFGYSLLNALDPNAAGAIVEAIQAEGNQTWLDQIRGREDAWDDSVDSGREEVIVLSSGSSDQNFEDLTSHCARAGTAHVDVAEPVHEVISDDDDVEVSVDPSAQLESRKKARTDRSGRREGKPEGKAAGSSRKRPSTLPCLDYVVVSNTLSGLGAGERDRESDPDDGATLSEHMKKKAFEDQKRQLDDGGRGNLLEELYAASAPPTAAKFGKKPRMVDISQITPPASPPSRTVGLTPPRDDVDVSTRGGEGFTEGVVEGGADAGGDGGGDKGKGVEVEMESSETTPQQTIYTKRPSGGGGATSGVVRSPHLEHDPADSSGNPACDELPHAPRWNLTQGSRMNDVNNCHEFFCYVPSSCGENVSEEPQSFCPVGRSRSCRG
ncbi:hypothetical protein HanRHA438_Chr04g0165171 [Helianthus annuus]|nr:hypothetical protein HanRHA438_Chr04g0165171 [Helianthus annuus]